MIIMIRINSTKKKAKAFTLSSVRKLETRAVAGGAGKKFYFYFYFYTNPPKKGGFKLGKKKVSGFRFQVRGRGERVG